MKFDEDLAKLLFARIKPLGVNPALERYGISPTTAEAFGCGMVEEPHRAGSILMPVYSAGGALAAVVGLSAVLGEQEYLFVPPTAEGRVLLNLEKAAGCGGGLVVVVAGALDCMRLYQLGCRNVVAILGSTLSEDQEAVLAEHFRQVLLMLPGTDEGWRATQDAIDHLAVQVYVKAAVMPSNKAPHELCDRDLQDILVAM